MSDTDLAAPSTEAAAADTNVEKVLALKARFFRYPAVDQIERELEQLMRYGSLGGRTGASANTFMLIGETGSGKTAILKRFLNRYPMRAEPLRNVHPVLYVKVPDTTSRKALAEQILRSMDVAVPGAATEARLTADVRHHLRMQGVQVLILDEAQQLVIFEKRRLNYQAADWIKNVANEGICAIVLAGMPNAWEAYLYNGQLNRRSYSNRRLSAMRLTVDGELRLFRALLGQYEKVLPFPERTELTDDLTLLRLLCVSGGYVGQLADFLVKATIEGLETGAARVTEDVFRVVAGQLENLDDPGWVNPFDMDAGELVDVITRKAQDAGRGAGVEQRTGLRRGRRGLKQSDVLPA